MSDMRFTVRSEEVIGPFKAGQRSLEGEVLAALPDGDYLIIRSDAPSIDILEGGLSFRLNRPLPGTRDLSFSYPDGSYYLHIKDTP